MLVYQVHIVETVPVGREQHVLVEVGTMYYLMKSFLYRNFKIAVSKEVGT